MSPKPYGEIDSVAPDTSPSPKNDLVCGFCALSPDYPSISKQRGWRRVGISDLGHRPFMGTADDTPRKPRRPLKKVPKYEEPNTVPLIGLSGTPGFGVSKGRFGHGSDGKSHHRPHWPGRFFLRLLGIRPRDPDHEEPPTREHETSPTHDGGTIPHP
jgi:hypothetical protein